MARELRPYAPEERALSRIPLARIQPARDRPRSDISRESVERLAESIRLHGLINPLLVREAGQSYQLIAGERRLEALKLLNRPWAEAIVLNRGDFDCALIALVENLQREDLHFLDVAAACKRLLEGHPITQERLAVSLSCSPSALANRLRLLKLPDSVQKVVRSGGLSERHARALLRLDRESAQLALATQAAERHLSVKQLEAAISQQLVQRRRPPAKPVPILRDNRIVINALMDTVRQLERIGVPVSSHVEEGAGYIDVIVRIQARNADDRLRSRS